MDCCGALIAPYIQRRYRFGQIIPALQWGYPLANILFVLAPNPLLMALVEAGSMAVDQVYDVVWPSYRMALIPDELQGRVTSAYRMIFSSMGPMGAALSGILIQRIGAAWELLVMAGFLIVVSVVVMLNPMCATRRPSRNYELAIVAREESERRVMMPRALASGGIDWRLQ